MISRRIAQSAVSRLLPIDVLISNAGAMFMAPVEATPPDQLERLLRQNTVGALRVVHAVLPAMRARAAAACSSCPASSDG